MKEFRVTYRARAGGDHATETVEAPDGLAAMRCVLEQHHGVIIEAVRTKARGERMRHAKGPNI
ncbi:MAG: hypothetical protein LUC93_05550 [Planctomycetaceae bacterium]|nr:hypothetical protein [Planctomycetaceae bacterium]